MSVIQDDFTGEPFSPFDTSNPFPDLSPDHDIPLEPENQFPSEENLNISSDLCSLDLDDKSEAIYQAAEMIIEAKHKDLVDELVEQNARASADEEYRKRLGLHNLSDNEKQSEHIDDNIGHYEHQICRARGKGGEPEEQPRSRKGHIRDQTRCNVVVPYLTVCEFEGQKRIENHIDHHPEESKLHEFRRLGRNDIQPQLEQPVRLKEYRQDKEQQYYIGIARGLGCEYEGIVLLSGSERLGNLRIDCSKEVCCKLFDHTLDRRRHSAGRIGGDTEEDIREQVHSLGVDYVCTRTEEIPSRKSGHFPEHPPTRSVLPRPDPAFRETAPAERSIGRTDEQRNGSHQDRIYDQPV